MDRINGLGGCGMARQLFDEMPTRDRRDICLHEMIETPSDDMMLFLS